MQVLKENFFFFYDYNLKKNQSDQQSGIQIWFYKIKKRTKECKTISKKSKFELMQSCRGLLLRAASASSPPHQHHNGPRTILTPDDTTRKTIPLISTDLLLSIYKDQQRLLSNLRATCPSFKQRLGDYEIHQERHPFNDGMDCLLPTSTTNPPFCSFNKAISPFHSGIKRKEPSSMLDSHGSSQQHSNKRRLLAEQGRGQRHEKCEKEIGSISSFAEIRNRCSNSDNSERGKGWSSEGSNSNAPFTRNIRGDTSTSEESIKINTDERRLGTFLSLGMEQDQLRLSKFLCFLRLECIEIFTATEKDVIERLSSKKVKIGQVGIRCRFCAHLPSCKRVGRSSNFPSSIDRLYQGVSMMVYKHFSLCEEMPTEIREKYDSLRNCTKKGDVESKSYWISSARMKGLVNCGAGIGLKS